MQAVWKELLVQRNANVFLGWEVQHEGELPYDYPTCLMMLLRAHERPGEVSPICSWRCGICVLGGNEALRYSLKFKIKKDDTLHDG